MKVLVTGAAGFIGSNFVFHMLEAHPDYEIVGLDALFFLRPFGQPLIIDRKSVV